MSRAFDTLAAADNDEIYGDAYTVSGGMINDIGNNVLITFKALDFGDEGASKITLCGKTPNTVNSVQLRYTGNDGVQHTRILEFKQSDELTEQMFDIEPIKGKNDVSFVFMPGSKFDFCKFRFEK